MDEILARIRQVVARWLLGPVDPIGPGTLCADARRHVPDYRTLEERDASELRARCLGCRQPIRSSLADGNWSDWAA